MLPLPPKAQDFCQCSTVKCEYQQPRFLQESVNELLAAEQELRSLKNKEATTLESKLFQEKYEEEKAQVDQMLVSNQTKDKTIEEQKQAFNTIQKELNNRLIAFEEEKANVSNLQLALEDTKRKLAEAEQLLNKSGSHSETIVKIMKLLEKCEKPQPFTSADQPADAEREEKHEEQL